MKTGSGKLVISNGTLIDGTGSDAIAAAAVVIQDGRITYAGPAAGADPDPGAQRIDARGGTIMPGLIESHFHATYFNVAKLEDLDDEFLRMLREFMVSTALAPVVAELAPDQPELRTTLLASQIMGLGMVRHVARIEPLASADHDTLVAAIGPTLQRYLTGDIDRP
jgi:cytosine/adenosine deaminase-related metal-dependent hydrolase